MENIYTVTSHKSVSNKSNYYNEIDSLRIQSEISKSSDQIAIDYMFDCCKWETDAPLYIVDMGSAYGFVSADRFSSNPRVKKILCFDNNARIIERARILHAENEKMIFEVADVEDENFVNLVFELMKKHDVPKVHVVFSTLLLHQLTYPMRALSNFRKLMFDDSYIIVRGSDDGSMLCYPNPELMNEIIQKGIEECNLCDRHNGSKLYTQLSDSGYKNVRMFSHMIDSSGLSVEEKETLFNNYFSDRLLPYEYLISNNPENVEMKKKYQWMKDALIRFESQFMSRNFWYCKYDYVAVATK